MGVRIEWARFLIVTALTAIMIFVLDIAFHSTLAAPLFGRYPAGLLTVLAAGGDHAAAAVPVCHLHPADHGLLLFVPAPLSGRGLRKAT